MLPEPSPDPASIATASASISQCQLAISDVSDVSSQMVTSAPRPVSAPLNTKHSAENLYVKRGSSKKSKIMDDTMNAIKNMAQKNVPPPNMDGLDMLGAYIASRLRSMSPKDREYYEREILKVLTQPTV
ncbi:mannosyl-oligosaccharide -alpha-mannosidase [Lasius niger]|uniref:Mannosyl-oligosaccharide-alpha-mannosidase n=1 Tax=Lasius niger TaxID=67767 RepID=A0A0J7KE18_LASNI|nr:mannosyl-oligosaccharide -alpha-mannosidase [Lasius niger]